MIVLKSFSIETGLKDAIIRLKKYIFSIEQCTLKTLKID